MAQHSNKKLEAASVRRERARKVRILRTFALVVLVAAAFALGFGIRGNQALMDSLGFPSAMGEKDQNPGATVTGSTYDSLSARVAEVEGILENESLDTYDLNAATTDVLDSFVAATEDPYLRYYDAARYDAYVKEGATGSYAGIGVLFAEYNGQAYAADVFEGSVAAAAGVREGDFVVAIDGDRSQEWTTTEVVNAVSREAGETVVVSWRRPASLEAQGGETFTTTLTCSEYRVPNVETELIGQVGYISLKQITQNSSSLVSQAVADLASQGAAAYVLDIRDCPGGYLTQAVDIASLFVKSGVIVQIQTKDALSTKTASGAVATDLPLVVLVNGNTAAAAEVLAAALQDSQRAQLVGTSTLGKGSVQVVTELSFGGALRYTAALYKSPLGRDINNAGVSPDVSVEADGSDAGNQKSLAVELAQSLVQD